jgi:hypothetical protein
MSEGEASGGMGVSKAVPCDQPATRRQMPPAGDSTVLARRISLLALFAVAICLSGSADPVRGQNVAFSRLSFLHLSADAPALDIYIDGGRAISGLNFTETSVYLVLAAGSHSVQVTAAGHIEQLISSTGTFDAGRSYTWVLSGLVRAADVNVPLSADLQFSRFLQLGDNAGDPADPRPRLRVVNASPGAGPLDIRIDPPANLTLATNLAYGGVGAYANLSAGSYAISVYPAGSTDAVASIPSGTLQLRSAYTLVFGGVLPGLQAANPINAVQGFQAVRLPDQNSVRSALLFRGCNQVIVSLPVGAPIAGITGRVDDPPLVASIWRFDNVTKAFRAGYFSDSAAPLDLAVTISSPEALFICVSAGTSWSPPG